MFPKQLKLILPSFYILYSIFNILFPPAAEAVCPVCTIAVGAGLGISRALGIDDAVTSVWIGGLILSMSFWFYDWLSKKKPFFHISYYLLLTIVLMYLLTIVPLYFGKFIGRVSNQIFGIDKIIFGTAIGSFAFILGKQADEKVRKIKGKQLFIYQKVIFPVSALLFTSLLLEIIIRSLR